MRAGTQQFTNLRFTGSQVHRFTGSQVHRFTTRNEMPRHKSFHGEKTDVREGEGVTPGPYRKPRLLQRSLGGPVQERPTVPLHKDTPSYPRSSIQQPHTSARRGVITDQKASVIGGGVGRSCGGPPRLLLHRIRSRSQESLRHTPTPPPREVGERRMQARYASWRRDPSPVQSPPKLQRKSGSSGRVQSSPDPVQSSPHPRAESSPVQFQSSPVPNPSSSRKADQVAESSLFQSTPPASDGFTGLHDESTASNTRQSCARTIRFRQFHLLTPIHTPFAASERYRPERPSDPIPSGRSPSPVPVH